MRTSHLGTAAAAGVPYEVFSGDIANVSDRTLRVIIQEFRRFAEQRQWQIIIPMFCQPVIEWFADAAALIGGISASEVKDVKRAEHAPHGWQYIHPVQDPQGKALEVTSGFRSRSSVIAERGDDPDTVDDERAADKEREKSLDLLPPELTPADDSKPADDTATKDGKQQPTQFERALTGLIQSQIAAMQVKPVAQAPAQPVQYTINTPVTVQNSVEPTPVTVQNHTHVEPTPVTVQNTVEGTTVNVDAPVVQVANTVQPAEVKVSLPVRKTETTVTYDANGNIASTVQIERDAEGEA